MISHVSHIVPLARIQRRRFLPVPGNVLVRVGQEVAATDVVAHTDAIGDHILLDIARGLGIARNKADKYIKRSIGEAVSKDSAIASRGGFASRVIRAPAAGKIVASNGGQVVLQVKDKPFELRAGFRGKVISIEADFGAILETAGAWIQGVWGNGKLNSGILEVIGDTPDYSFKVGDMSLTHRGSVLLAGHCSDREVLLRGRESQLRGLILGSMVTQLVPIAAQMPYPVMVIDGFGNLPMNNAAWTLLSTNAERDIAVNAMKYDRIKGERPEVIITLESAEDPLIPINLKQLKINQKVRVLRSPYQGKIGQISALLPGTIRFPSGLRSEAAEVEFERGEKGFVPLANIEVLG